VNARLQIALVLAAVFALGAVVLAARGGDEEEAPPSRETPLSEVFEGARMPAGVRAPDFSLHDQDGGRISMRELRGRPVIVTFLYTTCEDTCPTQAQTIKGALDELGRDVPALAIAVDPPRDTPRSARAFLAEHRMTGRMDFVLGTRAELRRLWRGYAIRPQSVREEHTGRYVLVDKRGFQRIGFPLDQATPERLAHDVRVLARG
jgi:protein SCO1/2